jgi:hypothetical protein
MQLEPWIKAIPESQAHGSGTLQKRLWRLKSDYVRIRDWHNYGRTVDSRPIDNWRDTQAGHFKPYSKCNGMFKFNEVNIHAQSANKNNWGDYEDWKAYEVELVNRYGPLIIEEINAMNRDTSLKFTDLDVKDEMRRTLDCMSRLPVQPDYYDRVMSLRS